MIHGMPKRLYVIENDSDQFTHGGHAVAGKVLHGLDEETVGVYELVEVRTMIHRDAATTIERLWPASKEQGDGH